MRMTQSSPLADDLFDRSSMSFREHLEELRKTLLKASIWLGLGTLVGLSFANSVVRQVKTPIEGAIRESLIARAEARFEALNGSKPAAELSQLMREFEVIPEVLLIDPFERIGSKSGRNYRGTSDAIRIDEMLSMDPWQHITTDSLKRLRPQVSWRKMKTQLQALSATEPFTIWLKAGVLTGIVMGSPGIFWHFWQFLAAGLYPHERRQVYWYLPLSLTLFLAGTFFAFFVLLQLILQFLISYSDSLDVDFIPRLNEYMSFAMYLPLGFGIAFQLPIVMLAVNRFGLIPTTAYVEHWRMAVLTIAFLSMILTPQEIYSMLGMFVPLTGLYFLGIGLCKYMPNSSQLGSRGYDPK